MRTSEAFRIQRTCHVDYEVDPLRRYAIIKVDLGLLPEFERVLRVGLAAEGIGLAMSEFKPDQLEIGDERR